MTIHTKARIVVCALLLLAACTPAAAHEQYDLRYRIDLHEIRTNCGPNVIAVPGSQITLTSTHSAKVTPQNSGGWASSSGYFASVGVNQSAFSAYYIEATDHQSATVSQNLGLAVTAPATAAYFSSETYCFTEEGVSDTHQVIPGN